MEKTVDEVLEYHEKQLSKLYYMKENYEKLSKEEQLKFDKAKLKIRKIIDEMKKNHS